MSARWLPALLVVAALSGCAASPSSGPAQPAVQETPPSNGAVNNQIPHGGSRTPDATTRAAVVAAMRADGIVVADEAALDMTYSADRQTVTVTGAMKRSAEATETSGTVSLQNKNGTWAVVK